jgi:predicted nuclease of predicted toxin-antitoxin system
MKILVDMNLTPRWADALSRRGIETVHWSDLGAAYAPDTEIIGALVTVEVNKTRLRILPLN